jgi:2-polyprenyl-3-methyl-5-hydroxy-6-metoxy-1,4-benzoquinol methylase
MITPEAFLQAELGAGIHHNNPQFMQLCRATVNAVKHLPVITVLDFGPGTGCYAQAFHEAGYRISVYDVFEAHRNYIRETFPHIEQMDEVQTTDLLVFIEVAEHMTAEELDALMGKIQPKYILFSSTSERTDWDLAWGHINIKEQREWVQLFQKYGYRLISEPGVPTTWSKLFKREKS